jgi:hypothetical protein
VGSAHQSIRVRPTDHLEGKSISDAGTFVGILQARSGKQQKTIDLGGGRNPSLFGL